MAFGLQCHFVHVIAFYQFALAYTQEVIHTGNNHGCSLLLQNNPVLGKHICLRSQPSGL